MGWWSRFWGGPYPGHGPWSYLPPWQRPGWLFGRGWYWLWYKYRYLLPITSPMLAAPIDPETEIRYLEELKRYISDVMLKEIDARIEELRRLLGKGQGSR